MKGERPTSAWPKPGPHDQSRFANPTLCLTLICSLMASCSWADSQQTAAHTTTKKVAATSRAPDTEAMTQPARKTRLLPSKGENRPIPVHAPPPREVRCALGSYSLQNIKQSVWTQVVQDSRARIDRSPRYDAKVQRRGDALVVRRLDVGDSVTLADDSGHLRRFTHTDDGRCVISRPEVHIIDVQVRNAGPMTWISGCGRVIAASEAEAVTFESWYSEPCDIHASRLDGGTVMVWSAVRTVTSPATVTLDLPEHLVGHLPASWRRDGSVREVFPWHPAAHGVAVGDVLTFPDGIPTTRSAHRGPLNDGLWVSVNGQKPVYWEYLHSSVPLIELYEVYYEEYGTPALSVQ